MGEPPEFFVNHNPEGIKIPFKKGLGRWLKKTMRGKLHRETKKWLQIRTIFRFEVNFQIVSINPLTLLFIGVYRCLSVAGAQS
jgi:hypothetical protein